MSAIGRIYRQTGAILIVDSGHHYSNLLQNAVLSTLVPHSFPLRLLSTASPPHGVRAHPPPCSLSALKPHNKHNTQLTHTHANKRTYIAAKNYTPTHTHFNIPAQNAVLPSLFPHSFPPRLLSTASVTHGVRAPPPPGSLAVSRPHNTPWHGQGSTYLFPCL